MKPLKTILPVLLILVLNGFSSKAISFLQASKSVNGPWSSDSLVIFTKDSLYLRFDVEVPGGSVRLAPIIDNNGNGIIDTNDFVLDDSSKIFMIDNGSVVEDGITINDLDPTLGTVIRYLPINDAPSLRVMIRLLDKSSYKDIVIYIKNPPADFTLSGNVYKPDGSPYNTAFTSAELVGDTIRIASFTDYLGYYEIPLNAGTYRVGISTMDDGYQGWDTTLTISGNLVINHTFKENNCYIRGYVKDQNQNPLDSVTARFNGGKSIETDSTGMYESALPSGDNRVSIDKDWLRNNKYIFNDNNNDHNFTLSENDSLLDNSITNFILYKTNSTISGKILGQNLVSLRLDFHFSKDTFNLNGEGISDPVTGNFMIDVFSGMFQSDTIKYWVGVSTDDNNYPMYKGFYITPTSYNDILPGTDTLKFTLTPNALNFSDAFNQANGNTLDWNVWNSYYSNSDDSWEPDSNNMISIKDSNVYVSVIANTHDIAQQAISVRNTGFSVNNSTYEFDLNANGIGNGAFRFSLFSSGSVYLRPTMIGNGEYNNCLFIHFTKTEGWKIYQARIRDQALNYNYSDELLLSVPDTIAKVKVKLILSGNNKLKFYLNGTLKGEISWASFLNAGFPFFQLYNYKNLPTNNLRIDNFMIYPDTLTTGISQCLSVNLPVALFPNPTSNIISFYIYSQEGGATRIELINTLGVNVYSRDYSNPFSAEHKGNIDLSQLRLGKGVYFLKIRNSQGLFTSKVVYE